VLVAIKVKNQPAAFQIADFQSLHSDAEASPTVAPPGIPMSNCFQPGQRLL
jgi:hypothetical protein